MIAMGQPNRIRSIRLVVAVSFALIATVAIVGPAPGAPDGGRHDGAPHAPAQWVPDVQKEWERHGGRIFQPVPADQPHATFVFRDVADRSGVGAFEIWVLVDGQRVKDWTASSPLRVVPGAHCIRVDMVSIPQRYEGTLGKYWPWLAAEWEHAIQLTRESGGAFRLEYQPTKFGLKGILDADKVKFDNDRPSDPEAAYTYCLEYIRRRP